MMDHLYVSLMYIQVFCRGGCFQQNLIFHINETLINALQESFEVLDQDSRQSHVFCIDLFHSLFYFVRNVKHENSVNFSETVFQENKIQKKIRELNKIQQNSYSTNCENQTNIFNIKRKRDKKISKIFNIFQL